MDRRLVYNKISEHLPCNVRVLDDSHVILDFGEFQDVKISILLEFKWEDNRLVDIRNSN